jgi:hypothetical protein
MSYYSGMYSDEQAYNDEQEYAAIMDEMNIRTLEMMMMDEAYAEQMDSEYHS